jgi:predicted transcriptional regulator of viral defense system
MLSIGSQCSREDLLALVQQMGVLRARDLRMYGISRVYLSQLVEEGRLTRVDRGLYVLPDAARSTHLPLAEAAKRVQGGVICLRSAFAFHHPSFPVPDKVWIALDRDAHRPKMATPPLHLVRFSGLARSYGVETHQVDGVLIRVYSPAKTVADCFKFRHKLGGDVALEVLRETWYTRRATLSDLWEAAQVCRVSSVMRPYLEILGA